MNQFSDQFLLKNMETTVLVWTVVSMLFLTWHEGDLNVYLFLFNLHKFMGGYLYFLNNLKDIEDHIQN